jgi:hypothetical protein
LLAAAAASTQQLLFGFMPGLLGVSLVSFDDAVLTYAADGLIASPTTANSP